MARRSISSVDTIWLNMDRADNLMVVESLMFLDGLLDLDRFREVLLRRVVGTYPVFRQRPASSRLPLIRPHWVDDPSFSLDAHLHVVELDPSEGEAAVRAYVDRHLGRPLRRDRPLWELHVLTGLAEGTAVYSRLHHSMADGFALMEVLLSMTDDRSEAPAELPSRSPNDDSSGVVSSGPVRTALSLPRQAGALLGQAPELASPARWWGALTTVRQGVGTGAKLLFTQNPATPVTGKPQVSKRVAWTPPIPLAPVKDAAHRTGVTVNDILVAGLAGALHHYVKSHHATVVDIPTMVPVNVRPVGEVLPRSLGNQFTLVLLVLPSGLSTPFERLAETSRRMRAIKQSPEVAMTYGLIRGIGLAGPDLERVLAGFFADRASGVTTNVPGPRTPRYLCGTRVRAMLGWAPESGHQTLGTAIFSYDGAIHVGFKVDADVVHDPEELVSAFSDEVEELCRIGRATTRGRGTSRSAAQARATHATVTAQSASPTD